jgi:GNAT superfamily N-acetyltransferase
MVGGKILSKIPGRKLEAGDLATSGGQMGRQRGAVAGAEANSLSSLWKDRGIKSSVSERSDSIILNQMVVPKSNRGRGAGTQAMQELIDYADSIGKRVDLSPSADFGGNKNRLTEFYKRFGFVENKGKSRDFEVSESMYRPASANPDQIGQRGAVAGNSPNDATPEGRQEGQPVAPVDQIDDGSEQFTPDGSIRLYHGGKKDLNSIKGSGESIGPLMENRFGGLFASAEMSTAKSFSENVYYMDIKESDIARNSDLDDPEIGDRIIIENTAEDITGEEVDSLYNAIIYENEYKNYPEQSGIDEERFTELFEGFSDVGEVSWEGQRLRGEIAKQLGFKAVEMRDETGPSYLVLPGTEVKRVTQGGTMEGNQ